MLDARLHLVLRDGLLLGDPARSRSPCRSRAAASPSCKRGTGSSRCGCTLDALALLVQMMMVLSAPPEAKRLPSREKARRTACPCARESAVRHSPPPNRGHVSTAATAATRRVEGDLVDAVRRRRAPARGRSMPRPCASASFGAPLPRAAAVGGALLPQRGITRSREIPVELAVYPAPRNYIGT